MAIYHFQMKTLSRSEGRSATAAAAYRSGQKIEDARTGKSFDYSKRSGVLLAEVITPDGGTLDREQLWNAVESAEKRCNSVVAREFVVALPHELSREQQEALVKGYAQGLSERTGWAIDVALHAPGKQGDLRNVHAHLLCSTRNVSRDPSGCPVMGSKTRDWDQRSSGSILIRSERSEWERCVNESLERTQVPSRVDCRSHAEKQTGLEPQIHLGPTVMAMERQGIQTERGDIHREIAQHNANVIELAKVWAEKAAEQEKVQAWERELNRLDRLSINDQRAAVARLCPLRVEDLVETHPTVQELKAELEPYPALLEKWTKVFAQQEEIASRVLSDYEYQAQFHPKQLQMAEGLISFNRTISQILETQDRLNAWYEKSEPVYAKVLQEAQALEAKLEQARRAAIPWARDEREQQLVRFDEAYERLMQAEARAWEQDKAKLEQMPYAEVKSVVESKRYIREAEQVSVHHPRLRQIPSAYDREWKLEEADRAAGSTVRNVKRWRESWCEKHPVKTFLHNSGIQKAPSLVLYDARIRYLAQEEKKAEQALKQAEGKKPGYALERERETWLIQGQVKRHQAQWNRFQQEAEQVLKNRMQREPEQEKQLQQAREQERSRGGGRSIGW